MSNDITEEIIKEKFKNIPFIPNSEIENNIESISQNFNNLTNIEMFIHCSNHLKLMYLKFLQLSEGNAEIIKKLSELQMSIISECDDSAHRLNVETSTLINSIITQIMNVYTTPYIEFSNIMNSFIKTSPDPILETHQILGLD